MKYPILAFKLTAASCLVALGAAAVLHHSGAALATNATPDFVSKILAKSFFEQIRVNTGAHGHDSGSDKSKDDADEKQPNLVKILARDPSDVYVVQNTVAPKGHSGWHSHPGPSIVLVQSGVASVYQGDDPSCTPLQYPAGTGFVDEGGTHVHLVRNAGSEPLVTVAFQILPAGSPTRRIDEPSPGFCSF
jgi:quercetin dioxygenase-like cupin family protein